MCATCSSCGRRAARGFTLPELIAVILIAGVLAVTVMPRLTGALSFRDDAFRDQVVAALRHARHMALSHRRLVCAQILPGSVTLTMATGNPANSCNTALPGIDRQAAFAQGNGSATLSSTPTATLYFQPTGRITTDGAGANAANWSLALSGLDTIALFGETGHVH